MSVRGNDTDTVHFSNEMRGARIRVTNVVSKGPDHNDLVVE